MKDILRERASKNGAFISCFARAKNCVVVAIQTSLLCMRSLHELPYISHGFPSMFEDFQPCHTHLQKGGEGRLILLLLQDCVEQNKNLLSWLLYPAMSESQEQEPSYCTLILTNKDSLFFPESCYLTVVWTAVVSL